MIRFEALAAVRAVGAVALVAGAWGAGACGGGGEGSAGAGASGASGGDAASVCFKGQTLACVGPGQCAGAQVCLEDGSGYGPCDCGGAGGAGGTGAGGTGAGGTGAGGTGAGGTGAGGTGAGGTGGGASGSSGVGGAVGSGGTGATGGTGGISGSGGADAGPSDAMISEDAVATDVAAEACFPTTVPAQRGLPDMYIMLDSSGSMDPDCDLGSAGTSSWCRAIHALDGFFQAPTSVGVGVALHFFAGTGCLPLSTPTVSLQELPAHLGQLQDALNAAAPGGGTHMEGALEGLRDYTSAIQRPGRPTVGVLVTDGDPSGCITSIDALASIIDAHFEATGIPTFIIGMTGATFSSLERLADGAGARPHSDFCGAGLSTCHSYDVGNGDPSAFVAALQSIQWSVGGCEYVMPTAPGGVLEASDVAVEYLPGGNPPTVPIPRVADASSCGTGGWFYDVSLGQGLIRLCPATCGVVQADAAAKINLQLACRED